MGAAGGADQCRAGKCAGKSGKTYDFHEQSVFRRRSKAYWSKRGGRRGAESSFLRDAKESNRAYGRTAGSRCYDGYFYVV